ncbi:hypothetical protein K7I13_07305 [Brucepastera parasyntrophica]|uniref:hypothetical protein n=1 Tax=Brucepastera parasyntrophica TaxID=2880008 RepID=UPI00210A0630|nr:hypothetical protein [Brucepastera parasyntrophica]ULQ61050.1 hypothetical protein K7I13_07305 [Brucepastera parasyntrophica]
MNNILPYGTQLKPLLIYSNLSDSSLRKFINKKGIFLSTYDRETIIPLLVSSLISPEEFEYLRKLHKNREEKIKRSTKRLVTNNDVDIVDALNDYSFDAESDSCFECYKYDISPQFTIEDNVYCFPYTITRIDRLQDWTDYETQHSGNIKISKRKNTLEIELESNYTSPETQDINTKIVNDITKHLRKKKLIDEKEKPTFIKYEDFSNKNRFYFLLNFKKLSKDINFIGINDIEFGPDETKNNHPEEIEWIKDHVKKLILKGKKLEDIPFLTKDENFEFLIIEKITYHYSFNIDGHTGECLVSMGFPNILKKLDPMNPFTYSYDNLKINWDENGVNKSLEKQINNFLSQFIGNVRDTNYEKYKS